MRIRVRRLQGGRRAGAASTRGRSHGAPRPLKQRQLRAQRTRRCRQVSRTTSSRRRKRGKDRARGRAHGGAQLYDLASGACVVAAQRQPACPPRGPSVATTLFLAPCARAHGWSAWRLSLSHIGTHTHTHSHTHTLTHSHTLSLARSRGPASIRREWVGGGRGGVVGVRPRGGELCRHARCCCRRTTPTIVARQLCVCVCVCVCARVRSTYPPSKVVRPPSRATSASGSATVAQRLP
jgi:hypothetical protein